MYAVVLCTSKRVRKIFPNMNPVLITGPLQKRELFLHCIPRSYRDGGKWPLTLPLSLFYQKNFPFLRKIALKVNQDGPPKKGPEGS